MLFLSNPNPIFPKWTQIQVHPHKQQHYHLNSSTQIEYTHFNSNYVNHIETAGFYNSTILFYEIDQNKKLRLAKHCTFPTFRKKENDTRGSFAFYIEDEDAFFYNQEKIQNETLLSLQLDGIIHIQTQFKNLEIHRTLFSSIDYPGFITKLTFTNKNEEPIVLQFNTSNVLHHQDSNQCFENKSYWVMHQICLTNEFNSLKENTLQTLTLKKNETITLYSVLTCLYEGEQLQFDCALQENKRKTFLNQINNQLHLTTNCKEIDTLFYFAKVRANESVFKTKTGYLHSPGGGQYYAAIWTNDQLEYANPFFAYQNYEPSYQASLNSMDLFQQYMFSNQPLVSSIIAEGLDYWNGAKDRGDGAMYAYGASRFLLTNGNEHVAKKYVKAIQWCLDYTLSKINQNGVIESDSDELENRFESGKANLSTNAIAYAALLSGADLFDTLKIANTYRQQAQLLAQNIDTYFFKNVENFLTYQYCMEENNLRSHMCYPLINGLINRKKEVIHTLLHSPLNTNEGFLTSTAENVFWDRVTLMAIRGIFCGEDAKNATQLLLKYTYNRLLSEHVPYPIEAYPEGNQAQLSAESALYARILIEGVMGYVPHSFDSFYLKPSLSLKLSSIYLQNIYLCNQNLHIKMTLKENNQVYILIQGKETKTYVISNYTQILISIK